MKDNFIAIIGAQRSGTTYLYHVIDAHPQIEMAKPIKPEPKFFLNKEFELGKDYYLEKFFSTIGSEINVIGEKGTSYLENAFVAKRIKQFFPEAKIIVTLRNPVYRALSNYFFSVNNGIETRTLKEVFIEKLASPIFSGNISVSPFHYLERSCYDRYLPPFIQEFSKNIKIVIFEEMIGSKEVIKDIYEFMGVDLAFVPDNINTKINSNVVNYSHEVSRDIRKAISDSLVETKGNIEQLLKRTISVWDDKI